MAEHDGTWRNMTEHHGTPWNIVEGYGIQRNVVEHRRRFQNRGGTEEGSRVIFSGKVYKELNPLSKVE
jgi:hypothetical protein